MSTSNVSLVQRIWQAYNRRDWSSVAEICTDDFSFFDNALGVRGEGAEQFVRYWQNFVEIMPDHVVDNVDYLDAGDVVVSIATGTGTNSGTGLLPATEASGKRTALRFCVLWRCTDDGRLAACEGFYDLLKYMVAFGYVEQPTIGQVVHLEIPPLVGASYGR
ncbi:nuclear transport factor 2 family protein [Actinokineospora sp. HUAS TT18]|uniref:nuclear transport factor 2 family protein n=1 Tax=Actinokineospora sp. HUAS TT18 TaxID=3447451 RepID=UPI003F525E44